MIIANITIVSYLLLNAPGKHYKPFINIFSNLFNKSPVLMSFFHLTESKLRSGEEHGPV